MPLPELQKALVTTMVFSRAYTFPFNRRIDTQQQNAVRSDGRLQTASIADPEEEFVLEFLQLPRADIDNLRVFLADPLVNYSANAVTFVDAEAVNHNVRFIDQRFDLTNIAAQLFNLRLRLRVEPVV